MRGKIEYVRDGVLRGWVWDPTDPDRQLDIEILINDEVAGSVQAGLARRDLASKGIGDGRHGFEFVVPKSWRDGHPHRVTLRPRGAKNVTPLRPVDVPAALLDFGTSPVSIVGRVEEMQFGKLVGWVWDRADPEAAVEVVIYANGKKVGTTIASRFRADLKRAGIGNGKHGFQFAIGSEAIAGDGRERAQFEVRALEAVGGQSIGHIQVDLPPRAKPVAAVPVAPALAAVPKAEPKATAPAGKPAKAAEPEAKRPPETIETKAAQPKTVELKPSEAKPPEAKPSEVKSSEAKPPEAKPPEAKAPEAKPPEAKASEAKASEAKASEAKAKDGGAKPAAATLTISEVLVLSSEAEQAKDYPRAMELLEGAVKRSPKNFDALFRLSRVSLAAGKVDQARAIARRAIAQKPDHPKPSIILARIAEMDGQRPLALEYWKNVPPNESAYFERLSKSARMLVALERIDEALACLREAVQLKPTDAAARRPLAQLLENTLDFAGALAEWKKLAELNPSDTKAAGKVDALTKAQTLPSYLRIPTRYRSVMGSLDNPVLLAVGEGLGDCLCASRLLTALAQYFDAKIGVVVPASTPAVELVFRDHPLVRRLTIAGEPAPTAELAFLLPEYVMARDGVRLPEARSVFNFVETRSPTGSSLEQRYGDYARWISDLTGMPVAAARSARPSLANPARAVAVSPPNVLVVGLGGDRGPFPAVSAKLAARLAERRRAVSVWSAKSAGFPDLTAGTFALAEAIGKAAVLVTASEEAALLALARSVPLVFAATQPAGVIGSLAPESLVSLPAKQDAGEAGSLDALAASLDHQIELVLARSLADQPKSSLVA